MLQNKILKTIKKYNLLSSGDRVLIAVSGGPDSLALLFIFSELSIKLGLNIFVGHLNHGTRGRAADLDEKFVKKVCQGLNVRFFSRKVKWSQPKQINEEKLRSLRYEFLIGVAKKQKIEKIALAHTLDDQAETVLMRLLRGTGLFGLISIMPKRKIKSCIIIRPTIEVSRTEIDDYLKRLKIKPRQDKTNFSRRFLRNRLRHEVLENLRGINPNIKGTLARFAQQAAIDYDYLHREASRFIKLKPRRLVEIRLAEFSRLHLALQRMVIRLALERVSGGLKSFTNKHWEEIQDLVISRPGGSIVNLTKQVIAKKDKNKLIISAGRRKGGGGKNF